MDKELAATFQPRRESRVKYRWGSSVCETPKFQVEHPLGQISIRTHRAVERLRNHECHSSYRLPLRPLRFCPLPPTAPPVALRPLRLSPGPPSPDPPVMRRRRAYHPPILGRKRLLTTLCRREGASHFRRKRRNGRVVKVLRYAAAALWGRRTNLEEYH